MRIGPITAYTSGLRSPYQGRQAGMQSGQSFGRLSQNRLEAMNQIYSEANQFMPRQTVSGTANNAISQESALRRYHGALEEWQNYLQFKKQATPQFSPNDSVQMRAVQDRLSMLSDLLNWVSDKVSPAPALGETMGQPTDPPLSRLLSQSGFVPPQSNTNPFSQGEDNINATNPFRSM